MQLTAVHVVFLVATIALALGIGIYSARSMRSAEGFSLAGRASGSFIIAGGISGAIIGGAATIGTAQLGFSIGLSAWWFTLGSGISLVLMGTFYARPLRRSGLETIPQFLVAHYGKATGPMTSVIGSLGILFSAVASALSGIRMISMILGCPPWQGALAIIALVMAYVMFGGLKGAGASGIVKMVVLWMTLMAAGIVAVSALGDVPDFDTVFPAFPWFSLFGRGAFESMGNLFSLIVGVLCTQTYVQAIYSASDSRTAVTGAFTAALIVVPVGLPSVAIGMFMHLNHPDIPPILALPMFLTGYLPEWLGGIGMAGLLLSVVGSIAGLVLGIGTMVARDIGAGVIGVSKGATLLWINRGTVFVITAIAVAIALGNLDSYVLDWNYLSMALRGGAVFIPLTLAVFRPSILSGRWAVFSMAVSTAAAVAGRVVFDWPINPLYVGLGTSAVLVLLGVLVTGSKRSRAMAQGSE